MNNEATRILKALRERWPYVPPQVHGEPHNIYEWVYAKGKYEGREEIFQYLEEMLNVDSKLFNSPEPDQQDTRPSADEFVRLNPNT